MIQPLRRRRFLEWGSAATAIGIEWGCRAGDRHVSQAAEAPIKVGILHSLTGTMAISENSVVDAELLAIQQINESGGVLGRSLLPIIKDGALIGPPLQNKPDPRAPTHGGSDL